MVWKDIDVVKWDQDVRATETLAVGKRKMDVHQALALGRKWRTIQWREKKSLAFSMRIPSLPIWGNTCLSGSFENWYPCLEEMMHFWPYPCRPQRWYSQCHHPCELLDTLLVHCRKQEPLVAPGTHHPSACSLVAPAVQPRSPKQEVGEICNRKGRIKGK